MSQPVRSMPPLLVVCRVGGGTGSALAPRNWRVAHRLIVLVAIPAVLALALAGLRITDATRSATGYGQRAHPAGKETSRHPAGPFSLVEVVRAAISEIEDYDRITLNVQQGVSVSGRAAADTVHLLAELVENATAFSARPPR